MTSEGFAAFALRARENGIADAALLGAFEKAGRERFAHPTHRPVIWAPRSLPIDCGETLESPDLQIAMLARLDLAPGQRILEIGTGSGFTAAVLGARADRLLTVERYRTLASLAREQMKRLGFDQVTVRHGNGLHAVEPDDGPFDRIVAWASFPEVPRQLSDMLASNGIAVIAVGAPDERQIVTRLQKVGSRFERTDFTCARMQPLADTAARAL